MYCLTEQQIDFIQDDISARGIRLVGLQQNLLDHICCVVEHNLEPDGDFASFYTSTIKSFYQTDLKEIEEETITLLTLKNFYVMKKIMLIIGGLSSLTLTVGLLFKFMHFAGASLLITAGVIFLSLLFLPLLFILKIKEKQRAKDRAILGLGTIAAILMSMHVLFKVMHWPFATMLGIVALGIMMLVFLPVYFFTGIRNPETKVNTIVSSIFILYGGSLLLTMVRSPYGSQKIYAENTKAVLRSEKMLAEQQKQASVILSWASAKGSKQKGSEIIKDCEELKSFLLKSETGTPKLQNENQLISDSDVSYYLSDSAEANALLEKLDAKINAYNTAISNGLQQIPVASFIAERKVSLALNDLIQIQMAVLQNQTAVTLLK